MWSLRGKKTVMIPVLHAHNYTCDGHPLTGKRRHRSCAFTAVFAANIMILDIMCVLSAMGLISITRTSQPTCVINITSQATAMQVHGSSLSMTPSWRMYVHHFRSMSNTDCNSLISKLTYMPGHTCCIAKEYWSIRSMQLKQHDASWKEWPTHVHAAVVFLQTGVHAASWS